MFFLIVQIIVISSSLVLLINVFLKSRFPEARKNIKIAHSISFVLPVINFLLLFFFNSFNFSFFLSLFLLVRLANNFFSGTDAMVKSVKKSVDSSPFRNSSACFEALSPIICTYGKLTPISFDFFGVFLSFLFSKLYTRTCQVVSCFGTASFFEM